MIDRACISLSNVCNLKCRYCHFQDKQQIHNRFSYEDLVGVVTNIHDYAMKNNLELFKIGIVGAGEPLSEKEMLFRLLAHIGQNAYGELKLYTISNGTLLNRKDIDTFYEYKDMIRLCISLDGYRQLHNYGRDMFDKVMQTIDVYYRIFGEKPYINATVNKLSYENKEKLIDFFLEQGFLNITFSKLVGYSGQDLFISGEEFREFMEYAKARGVLSRQFQKEKKYDCTMYGALCGVGRTNIFYSADGVYPCGRFYKNEEYKLGASRYSLFDIENTLKKLRPVKDGECYYEKYVEGRK